LAHWKAGRARNEAAEFPWNQLDGGGMGRMNLTDFLRHPEVEAAAN